MFVYDYDPPAKRRDVRLSPEFPRRTQLQSWGPFSANTTLLILTTMIRRHNYAAKFNAVVLVGNWGTFAGLAIFYFLPRLFGLALIWRAAKQRDGFARCWALPYRRSGCCYRDFIVLVLISLCVARLSSCVFLQHLAA